MSEDPIIRCNFCGLTQHQVKKIVASTDSGTNICSDCVIICVRVMIEGDKEEPSAPPTVESPPTTAA